jgi:uncharacterized protein YukE
VARLEEVIQSNKAEYEQEKEMLMSQIRQLERQIELMQTNFDGKLYSQ